jgi:cytosine/adenosine deaminase-related metal-dependent hydrolase
VSGQRIGLDHVRIVRHDEVVARSVAFSDGRIAASIGDALRIDLRDHFVFPGLINAHDHLQLNAIPRLAHAEPFANSYAWIDAFEVHRGQPDVVAAVNVAKETRLRHGGLKNLLGGATTVAHHDPWDDVFDDDFPVAVVRRYGWCHSLRLGAARDGTTRYGPPVRDSFAATSPDAPWIIHLAEGTDGAARAELGCLDAMRCLGPNTVIVHGVGMTVTDIGRVIERGASVVWCPSSNVGMLGRTLEPRRLADARRLALGTDSRLTGSRDLLDELRTAAASSDLSPRELLRTVAVDARRVLGLPEEAGLEPGEAGDCLIVHATTDPYDALLVTRRSDIRAVVRGGVPMIADPDFASWFAQCGVATRAVRLDGRPKLMPARLARPEVVALEPGLELAETGDA